MIQKIAVTSIGCTYGGASHKSRLHPVILYVELTTISEVKPSDSKGTGNQHRVPLRLDTQMFGVSQPT